jgi:hypothetical protein
MKAAELNSENAYGSGHQDNFSICLRGKADAVRLAEGSSPEPDMARAQDTTGV